MTEQNQTQETVAIIDPSSTTVQDMFGKILSARLQSGALEKAIEKNVDSLIADAASDVFRSYGDVGKKLKELLTAAIAPDLNAIDSLPSYHEFVVNRVRNAAQGFFDTRLTEALDKELADIIGELPEKATLSWVIDQIKESISEDCSCDHSEFELPMIIEVDRDFTHIYIHDEEKTGRSYSDNSKYGYKYQIHLNKGEIYSLKIADKESKTKLAFGAAYGVEKVLFHLYALRGTIELDHGTDPDEYDRHAGPDYD